MTRDEIVEKLKAERILNRPWPDFSKWEQSAILAELGGIADALARAGLTVIPAEPGEDEVKRVADAIRKAQGLKWPNEDEARAACRAVREMK